MLQLAHRSGRWAGPLVVTFALWIVCLSPAPASASIEHLGQELPLTFIENRGQWDTDARFVLRNGSTLTRLATDGLSLQFTGRRPGSSPKIGLVRLAFEGGEATRLLGEGRQETSYNYFLGRDSRRWQTDVPGYDSVLLVDVFPGIDLRAYSRGGHLEYDVLLRPGADLRRFRMRCEGVEELSVAPDGALVMETELGTLRQLPPVSFVETAPGRQEPIASRFELLGDNVFGFEVPGWDHRTALRIDPEVEWSTFLGDSKSDYARALSVNQFGTVVVAGETSSPSFPTTPGAHDRMYGGKSEVFITALNANGSRVRFSTFIGGAAAERVSGIYVDPETGAAVIAGETFSPDFPLTSNALDTTLEGEVDAFLLQLAPAGNRINYSTLLGGNADDRITALAFTPDRVLVVAGETDSSDFPTTAGSLGPTPSGERDGFVTAVRFIPGSSPEVVFSTYLGGGRNDTINDLAFDPVIGLFVAGTTFSHDFPTTQDAYDREYGGKGDAFLSRLSFNGAALEYSTLFGAEGNEAITAMAFRDDGKVALTGHTWSEQFPVTPDAVQTTRNGGLETFVALLDPAGAQAADLQWATFFGGNKLEYSFDVAVDASGGITIIGETVSEVLPTTPDAVFPSAPGVRGSDVFLTRFSPDGSELVYSTYFGDRRIDSGNVLWLDGPDAVILVGHTLSPDFPVTGGVHDPTHGGAWDVFITRMTVRATPGR